MSSAILVHPNFDGSWPFAADHFLALWAEQGAVVFHRLAPDDPRSASEVLGEQAGQITRLTLFGVPFSAPCAAAFTALAEAHLGGKTEPETRLLLTARGVRLYQHTSEGFWGESVSEFGLALTLCGLRRIPQLHHQILTDLSPWDYNPPGGVGQPGVRGHQFGDDPSFTSGTIAGKRVRIVGAGNIASRYASFCHLLGADVAAWDPFATDPNFHRAGSRREHHLDRLVADAQIFAPMVPLTEKTRGLITVAQIDALPTGCLVVLVTRANICDMAAVRRRVLANELTLAADVFDIEPLPLDDPLLGRDNVVHTPHNAGRTIHANEQYARMLAEQFLP